MPPRTAPDPYHPSARPRAAFTLVECLVVFSLLVVLLAILLPTLQLFRGTAGAVKCANNLRQSGAAMNAFAADNNGLIHLQVYNAKASPTTMRWCDYLMGTVAGTPLYLPKKCDATRCPMAPPSVFQSGYVYGTLDSASEADPYDFVPAGQPASSRAVRLQAIETPAAYWMLVDSWADSLKGQIYIIRKDDTNRGRAHLRHRGRANVLFADGHVRALGGEEFKNLTINPLFNGYDENYEQITF